MCKKNVEMTEKKKKKPRVINQNSIKWRPKSTKIDTDVSYQKPEPPKRPMSAYMLYAMVSFNR
jgi:hypothetical protein